MLKIALAIVLGGLVYRLVVAVTTRSSRRSLDNPEGSQGRTQSDSDRIVDADFREVD